VTAARTDDRLAREVELVQIEEGSGEVGGEGADVPGAAIRFGSPMERARSG
jgi:hypothetical protein